MSEFIKVEGVYFSYNSGSDKDFAISNVSFNVLPGEMLCIVGANGSGKSTIAKMLNGVITPFKGSVVVDGIDSRDLDLVFKIRQNVGLVFQNPDNQIVATVVQEDVAFALENLCVEHNEIGRIVDMALDMVGMRSYKDRLVEGLSGGQKSKVAIAGVLAMNPKCIVLDEATAMLDPKSSCEVLNIVKNLNKKNKTTIINITHRMQEVAMADRVIVLNKGVVLAQGSPRDIFLNDCVLQEAGLCLPQVSQFVKLLHKDGVVNNEIALDVDECVRILSNLLEGA